MDLKRLTASLVAKALSAAVMEAITRAAQGKISAYEVRDVVNIRT